MENAYTEYKRELTDGLEKEVVAFLNTLGGDILIGIEDNGECSCTVRKQATENKR